jgi:hypothetical protein
MLALVIAMQLVQLTGPNGQVIYINPVDVVTIRQPTVGADHFHTAVKCVIFTVDGRWLGVVESCADVERLIEKYGNSQ